MAASPSDEGAGEGGPRGRRAALAVEAEAARRSAVGELTIWRPEQADGVGSGDLARTASEESSVLSTGPLASRDSRAHSLKPKEEGDQDEVSVSHRSMSGL